MPLWLRHHLLIVAVAGAILFCRLGAARLWDRDEPRNARCAVEMMERGDWVVPYFNGELRTHKPVLLYWLIMSAYRAFGVSEFAARFWSAALGVGTVVCTYHLAARLFDRRSALWAALALAPALMFDVASRAATPDASLIFFVTASLTAFVLLAFREPGSLPRFPSDWRAAASIYALVALAVLAKGPVGFVMPVAIMAASLWMPRLLAAKGSWRERLAEMLHGRTIWDLAWEMRPLVAIAMLLLVAVPWYALVDYRTEGEFLRGFFWEHNVRRATESMEGHRGSALFFYPLTLLIGFFPASVFLVPALLEGTRRIRTNDRQRSAIVFCLVWMALFVGVFSLAKTKLPSYVTPCYPAMALLVGNLLHRWTSGQLAISPRWLDYSLAWLAAVGLVVAPVLYFAAERYLPGEQWLAGIGVVLALGGAAALLLQWQGLTRRAAAVAIGSGLVFSLLLFALGPAAADRHQQSHLLLATVRFGGSHAQLAAWHCLEPSWVFYWGRPIVELPDEGQAIGQASSDQQLAAFFDGQGRFLVVKQRDFADLAAKLPTDVEVLAQAPLFLKDDELLVLGRRDALVSGRGHDAGATDSQTHRR
jgi:4-amino-4-deoxy-L-arabinose transferase-like glycosyltransferase